MSIIIGIDHGYYAIKTAHCSFPAGLTSYGEHEPYTRQGLLEFGGCFFVCGSGRQPIQRDKTANDNYYLLTLAAIAKKNPAARSAARMFGAHCGGSAADKFWARQTQVQRVSVAEQAAGELQVRGRGVQHYHRGSCCLPSRLRRPYDRSGAFAGRTVHAPHGLGRLDGGPHAHRQRHPCGRYGTQP